MAPQSYSGLSSSPTNPPPGLPDTHSGSPTLLPPQPPLNSQERATALMSAGTCWFVRWSVRQGGQGLAPMSLDTQAAPGQSRTAFSATSHARDWLKQLSGASI